MPVSGKRRSRRPLFATVALAYLLLMTFGGCADRFLLFPSRHPIDAGRAEARSVEVDGRKIEVWTARSPACFGREPEGFVLEFCGNATRAEHIAQFVADRWRDQPVEVWVMNYPGFGGSEGRATLKSIPPAALATYDALRQVAGDRPIFLAGNSMGATPALYVASRRPVAGMILQNTPALRRIILRRHGWWNLWLFAVPVALQVPDELEVLGTAPRVTAPAVFMIADHDGLVPPAYQRLVVNAYAGPKKVIRLADVGHNSPVPATADAELSRELDWLWQNRKNLAPATAPAR